MTEPVWAQDEERNEEEPRTVLIFGDSITAGQGVDMDEAFPALLQDKVDSLGWNVEFVNAGLSGETTAGGVRRIDWVLQRKVDLFVLELGGNDGLRGIEPEVTRRNLQEIMDKVHSKYPETTIILTGMEAPPNMGPRYTTRFREIFQELAHQNEVIFMPFILEGVGGNPELNQSDGIHPTAEGHRKIAENLWSYLKPVLEKDAL
ncbi:MAG: arylesterase [Balneolaceae bacterium]